MNELVLKSKQLNAIEIAEEFGIDVHKHKYTSKEQNTICYIMKAFHGEAMSYQFTIDNYRIHLYFPKHRIAVECDEFNHRDRDIGYDVKRQRTIENLLSCRFIRFNPDANDFCVFEVTNQIVIHILI